jgi:hypothetical protein
VKLYQQGVHLPTYKNLMLEMGVKDVSLNFMGMRQRVKNLWDLETKFDSTFNFFVDSGCQTLNDAEEQYSDSELRDLGDRYYEWVCDNINRIEYFTEFDARGMGNAHLRERRDSLQGSMYDKVVPIWNPANGLSELDELAQHFGRVGILQTTLKGRDLVPHLSRLATKGIGLHGLSMTKPDLMKAVPWESVSSTSWTSPGRYGDTIIWSHNQLKRYPKSMKDQARKKERSTFISAGFDIAKIDADDNQEMLRISLWSWSRLMESINLKTTGVTTSTMLPSSGFTDLDTDEVGTVPEKAQNRLPTTIPRDASQKRLIPFMEFDYDTEKKRNKATGEMEDVEVSKLNIRGDSMRICDSCFLAERCPMFVENSTCAYEIPIVVRTKEQMTALMDSMVEMQAHRVLFMKMAEDIDGQGIDPILSAEMDRAVKFMKTKHEMEQEGFSLTVTAKQQGQMSMVDRIFGDIGNTKPLHELPSPLPVVTAVEQLGILDAEMIEVEY